jgi:hypothetical protein
MATYRVIVIRQPEGWQPRSADDAPPVIQGPVKLIGQSEQLFEAVRRAIYFNQKPRRRPGRRWAVVVDPETTGRAWPAARLVTPITYKVLPIWWPEGWEPESPQDVPNCLFQAKQTAAEPAVSYQQAENTVLALNRQAMNWPGSTWYVVAAVENEPVAVTVSVDPQGLETTAQSRRMHIVRSQRGGKGNCDRCPAHSLPCAQQPWREHIQTITDVQSRWLRGPDVAAAGH